MLKLGGGRPPCPPVEPPCYRELELLHCISSILIPDTYVCDSEWQFSRDGLITTAFVLSGIALMVIVQAILVAVCVLKKKRKDNSEPEVGEFNALLCNILLVVFVRLLRLQDQCFL